MNDISAGPVAADSEKITTLLKNIDGLTPLRKAALIHRFQNVDRKLRARAKRYGCFFNCGRITVTAGSLIIPALISIEYTKIADTDLIYWITWIISFIVSMCNGMIALFKMDKKYYFLYSIVEILYSEAWQYISLSGRYGDLMNGANIATYENQYRFFFYSIEKIKLAQVEEEYYKMSDLSNKDNTAHTRRNGDEAADIGLDMGRMHVPTPAPAPV